MTHEISQIGKDNYPIILLNGKKCKKRKEKKKHTKLRRTRYWLPEENRKWVRLSGRKVNCIGEHGKETF